MTFSDRVVAWQRRHGRHDLPWQRTRDPYLIWLSEVMLQQTQVATVIPYFDRFVGRFPDVRTLAAAALDDVMAAWAGLGYYSRARNLHRCAGEVVARHGGEFPRTTAALAELPGIGRSTAAAIAAFAYGERAAILDGNVKRVFARHFGIEGHPGAMSTERAMWHLAEAQLPVAGVESYTQGLMDLGATVCVRRRPRCDDCPVSATCVARTVGRVGELPAPRPARSRPLRTATLALLVHDGMILIERRALDGIWGGLFSVPEFDADFADAELQAAVERRFGLHGAVIRHFEPLRHEFSHYSFLMQPRVVRVTGAAALAESAGLAWLALHDVDAAALPAPVRRLLRAVADGERAAARAAEVT
jgi:A/G-specific adenine glycosylase